MIELAMSKIKRYRTTPPVLLLTKDPILLEYGPVCEDPVIFLCRDDEQKRFSFGSFCAIVSS